MNIDTCDECAGPSTYTGKLTPKPSCPPQILKVSPDPDDAFIKNRKCFEVAKYALADVIEALSNDQDHFVRIVVTKEDGNLVVMFERKHKSASGGACDGGSSIPNAL